MAMEREEADLLSTPQDSPDESSQLAAVESEGRNGKDQKLTSPANFDKDDSNQEADFSDKISELLRDFPTPPTEPLPASANPDPETPTTSSFLIKDSSKLSALVTNSFQTNVLLQQLIYSVNRALEKMGFLASLIAGQLTYQPPFLQPRHFPYKRHY